MLATIKLLLFLLQFILFSSAECSPFGDDNFLEWLIDALSYGERKTLLGRTNKDERQLANIFKIKEFKDNYVHYLFARFPEEFATAFESGTVRSNNRFLVLLTEQALLPKEYQPRSTKTRFTKLHKAYNKRSLKKKWPIPAPETEADVPKELQPLFRTIPGDRSKDTTTYRKLKKIFIGYVNSYPADISSKIRRSYFSKANSGAFRLARLKEAFILLVAQPFYQLIKDGFFVQSSLAKQAGWPTRQELICEGYDPDNLTDEDLASMDYAPEEFDQIREAVRTAESPALQRIPPLSINPDQIYSVRIENLYSANLPVGRFFLLSEDNLIPYEEELQQLNSPAFDTSSEAESDYSRMDYLDEIPAYDMQEQESSGLGEGFNGTSRRVHDEL